MPQAAVAAEKPWAAFTPPTMRLRFEEMEGIRLTETHRDKRNEGDKRNGEISEFTSDLKAFSLNR
jgi:hypothetical protein